MDDRSTDEDESGSETDDSVVANSVESARTPSPSILGGLEFLDRLIKRDTPADFEFKQQKKQCGQIPQNQDGEEKHQGKSPSNKSYSSCSKDAGLLQFPLFKPVQNYHHSPVFTPPRKSFLPSSDTDKDENILPSLALLSATSSLGLEITDGPEAYSQALFSSNQSSCPSLDLSFITGGNLSSTGAGDETRNQLSSLTDKIIHSITQAGEDVDNKSCKLDEAKAIQNSIISLTRPVGGTKLSGGPEKSKQVRIEQLDEDVPENGSLAGYKSDGTIPLTAKESGTDCSGNSRDRNAVADDNCKENEEKLLSSDDGEISTKEKVSRTSEKEPTNAAMFNNNVDLRADVTLVYDDKATHEGNGKGPTVNADAKDLLIEQAVNSEPVLLPSEQDESNEIDHILEEYKQVEAALKENDHDSTVLSNIKEKLSTLKEKMKAEANSLKEKRDKILSLHSHAATTTTTSQPKKEEELLGLSFKQKQILSLLAFHKELAGVLYSKMMETNLYTGEEVTGPDEGIGPNGCESTIDSEAGKFSSIPTERIQTCTQRTAESQFNKDEGNNLTQTQSDDEVTNSSEMDPTSTEMTHSQQKSTQSARTARIPHLTLKDLIDERVITPQKNCLSISGKGRTSEAELLPDGSVLSKDVWYKTEREWYAEYSNQPITAIKRPRLWNLITYKGELLSNLACQCQLLCIAKTINPIQSTTVVTKPPIPANSFKYQTKLPGERSVSKKQSSFYDSIDLSSIKSIYLIGNDELFPTEDLFQDGFWRNDGGSDSLVPPCRLNDLTRWEE